MAETGWEGDLRECAAARGRRLREFVRESNRIEGIVRQPRAIEVRAHERLLAAPYVDVPELERFVLSVCGARLRSRPGMDVSVGGHVPPSGGRGVPEALDELLVAAYDGSLTPYEAHVAYETLHPFMDGNGRSGRALWAWQMLSEGLDPFGLPFLHRFYYQALEGSRARA